MPQYMLTLIHSVILAPRTARAFCPGSQELGGFARMHWIDTWNEAGP